MKPYFNGGIMINVPMSVTQGMLQPQYVQTQTAPAVKQPEQQQYNAVSITIDKPAVDVGNQSVQNPFNTYSYTPAPIYDYPQASVYSAPVKEQPVAAAPLPIAAPAVEVINQNAQESIPESVIVPQPLPLPAEAQPAAAPLEMAAVPDSQPPVQEQASSEPAVEQQAESTKA